MSKVYTPVKNYNGISAGISFRDGVGETDSPHLLDWFWKHGYRVEEKGDSSVHTEEPEQDFNTDETGLELDPDTEEPEEKPVSKKRTAKA